MNTQSSLNKDYRALVNAEGEDEMKFYISFYQKLILEAHRYLDKLIDDGDIIIRTLVEDSILRHYVVNFMVEYTNQFRLLSPEERATYCPNELYDQYMELDKPITYVIGPDKTPFVYEVIKQITEEFNTDIICIYEYAT
jgi:hypothetical protein